MDRFSYWKQDNDMQQRPPVAVEEKRRLGQQCNLAKKCRDRYPLLRRSLEVEKEWKVAEGVAKAVSTPVYRQIHQVSRCFSSWAWSCFKQLVAAKVGYCDSVTSTQRRSRDCLNRGESKTA